MVELEGLLLRVQEVSGLILCPETEYTYWGSSFLPGKRWFLLGATVQLDLGRLVSEVLDHTQLHTRARARGRNPLDDWLAGRRDRHLHNTQQTQETNIHALSGIRTRDLGNRVACLG
jgi:hypothetical protein